VVGGLFGFERTAADRPLSWSPCLPAQWEAASLRLGETTMSAEGRAGGRRYELRLPAPQPVECRLPLFGHRIDRIVDAQGKPMPHEVDGPFVTLQLPASSRHTIVVHSTAVGPSEPVPAASEEPVRKPSATIGGRREAFHLGPWLNADQLKTVNHGAPCVLDFRLDGSSRDLIMA